MKKKIRVGLVGASGRMGLELVTIINSHPRCALFYPYARGETWDRERASRVDVWIDFSSPEALEGVLRRASEFGTPVVCGTTGFNQKQKNLISRYAKKIPLLWSSNMSLGVSVLIEALQSFSAISQFDFQIEEIHHNRKKDKPSGTAITLQESLDKVIKKKSPEPLSIRGGGVFGIHKVYAMSDEEVLVFEHSALNRTVFARGALRAAEWLVRQKRPGLYKMRDVLFREGP